MGPTNSAGALSQLQQAQSQAQDPNSILQAQNQQLGVNNAQQTVTGLRGAINNTTKLLNQVAPSVMGRTANSLVTNAQATRQIGNEQAPISKDLAQEGTDYDQANSDLSNLRQEARTAASGIYQGQQDKLSYAQNLYNTLYQKERDAQAAQQVESDRQEQARQFNASLASRSSGGGSSGSNTSNPNNSLSTPAIDPQQQQAANALTALFKTNNAAIVSRTIAAIKDSANRGNTYDKTKLQLIDMYKKSSPYAALITKAGG
jgi:hypothetical protein